MERYNVFNTKINAIGGNCDEIKKHLDLTSTLSIYIDYELIIGDKTIYYNDDEHIISYFDDISGNKIISISQEYFNNNRNELYEFIIETINNYQNNEIVINNKDLMIDDILIAISKNSNIKKIRLYSENEPIELTKNMYEILKKSHTESIITEKVSKELSNNFDPIIYVNKNKPLIGNYSYEDISNTNTITLFHFEEKQFENIKYIPDGTLINFGSTIKEEIIIKFIEKAQKEGKKLKYVIHLDEDKKIDFNRVITNNIINEDINIEIKFKTIPINKYIEYEQKLTDLIVPALNLSPFEKYLYAYNVVKKYKEYKENDDDKESARNLYDILDNEYMVCVGYSVMLKDLLSKLGIKNINYGCNIYTSYDNLEKGFETIPDEIEAKRAGHDRLTVKIEDSKYGIDGIFVSDPTWDNIMNQDAYNYALINSEELVSNKRYVYFEKNNMNEIIMSQSIEEFYQKINFILDHNEAENINEIITKLLNITKILEPKLYDDLCEKYSKFNIVGEELTNNELSEIIEIFANYYVSKTNTLVTGNTFKDAITFLYSQFSKLEGKDLEDKIEEIMEFNKERQEDAFPLEYIITKEGEKIPYMNIKNKFDLENIEKRAL